jgi:hypothetical protein
VVAAVIITLVSEFACHPVYLGRFLIFFSKLKILSIAAILRLVLDGFSEEI